MEGKKLTIQKPILVRYLDRLEEFGWEELCEFGRQARFMRDVCNWWIGKVALTVIKKYGEDKLGDFAREIGLKKVTIEQYRWVVSKFGPDYKPDEEHYLSWSYYRLAAGTGEPAEWIEKTINNDWTVIELEKKIKGLPIPKECDHDFKKKMIEVCEICGITKKK